MTAALDVNDLPRLAELDSEFEIVEELGRGATAIVYLARERELGRRVAIKVIRPAYMQDEEAAARLAREAQTVASLEHPNIVMLYGTRRLRDNSLALIMQYIPGRTLKHEVGACGPLPFDRVERILTDLGKGLSCAQRQRIIHRDIKPENVYIEAGSGSARLADFGIARQWGVEQNLTLPGVHLGTPLYMSPEQIDAQELDGRSDLYSLGLVGYEMLTGRPPWDGQGLLRLIYSKKHETLPDLETLRPGIPFRLRNALDGLLRKDREERWRDADEFLAVLRGDVSVRKRWSASQANPPAPIVTAQQPDSETTRYRPDHLRELRDSDPNRLAKVARFVREQAPELAGQPVLIDDDDEAPIDKPFDWQQHRREVAAAAFIMLVLIGTSLVLARYGRSRAELTAVDRTPVAAPASAAASRVEPKADARAGTWLTQGDRRSGLAGDTLPIPRPPLATVPALHTADVVRPTSLPIRSGVSVGGTHTCSVNADGAAICWGDNRKGQLGDGSISRQNRAVTVHAPESFATLSAGISHTCSVGVSGRAYCWGSNSGGQLGDGTQVDRARPTRVSTSAPMVRVFAGMSHSCALDAEGRLFCWGQNTNGQLGDDTHTDRTEPVRVAGSRTFRSVTLGWAHTCALAADGTAFCWGRNEAGELGDGSTTDRTRPAPVSGGSRFTSIAAGSSHTCGLTISGSVLCWGQNLYGQLGNNTTEDSMVPVAVEPADSFAAITVGSVFSCALTRDRLARCWGRNSYGQLGDGTVQSRLQPTPVTGDLHFDALQASGAHTCGVSGNNRYCWGYNIDGQLGDGTRINQPRPVPVIRR